MLQTKDEFQAVLDSIKAGSPLVLRGTPSQMEDWWAIYRLVCGRRVVVIDNSDGSEICRTDADTMSEYLEDQFWHGEVEPIIAIVWHEDRRRFMVDFSMPSKEVSQDDEASLD